MKHYKNFTIYKPEINPFNNDNVVFCKDENGNDWYNLVKKFQPDTVKLMYDKEGNINSVTKDASGLFPNDLSVLEVEKVEENFDQFKYRIVDGKIIVRVPNENDIRNTRNVMLRNLDDVVSNPLRFNSFSQDTKDKLAQYRLDLLDITEQIGFPENVKWPTMPELK